MTIPLTDPIRWLRRPNGLVVTNCFYDTGFYANYLQKRLVYESYGGSALSTNTLAYTNGLVYTSTDEQGLTVTNTWDALRRLTSQTYPDGTCISNVYTYLDLTATKDRLGNWTYYGFDALRRRIAQTNALGQVTWWTYCGCGSPETISNAVGVTTMLYDNAGRVSTVVYPDNTDQSLA